MKTLITSLIFVIFFSTEIFSQLYQGPASGSVPNGAIANTETFLMDMSGDPISPYIQKLRNEEEIEPLPDYLNKVASTGPIGSNYIESSTPGTNIAPCIAKKLSRYIGPRKPDST